MSYGTSVTINNVLNPENYVSTVNKSGQYVTATGEILVADLSNQPANYIQGVSYLIVNTQLFTDANIVGFEMIATQAGTINVTVIMFYLCHF